MPNDLGFTKEIAHSDNYMFSLYCCPQCGQMWCLYCYEPYSSFPYFVKWEGTAKDFKRTDLDKLLDWHAYSINHEVNRLPLAERKAYQTGGQISGCVPNFNDLTESPSEKLK
jgi:hypothetical protein